MVKVTIIDHVPKVPTVSLPDDAPGGGPTPSPGPEVWRDVEIRLLGYLRSELYGVKRSPQTPASINRKAITWLTKYEDHIGEYAHPAAKASLAARCCNIVLLPSLEEAGLMDLYGDPVCRRAIDDINNAVEYMEDSRRRVGWGWWSLAVGGVMAGVVTVTAGHEKVGTAIGTIGALASVKCAVSHYQPQLSAWWHGAWHRPARQ